MRTKFSAALCREAVVFKVAVLAVDFNRPDIEWPTYSEACGNSFELYRLATAGKVVSAPGTSPK